MPHDAWMLIGRIVGPFGVHGEIKVDVLTDFPERFQSLERVYVGATHHLHNVEATRKHKGQVLLRLEGVSTPEAVRELGMPELFVPRAEATSLPEGHFYLEDVLGISVQTTEGTQLGTIHEVLRTGSNEVFVVKQGRNEVLIPVIKDAVQELDLENRVVTVEPWVLTTEE